MKCLIKGQSLPAWYRIIHRLVEISDSEIFFDFADRIMTISTTNSALTTYSTFLLFRKFFEEYEMTSEEPEKISIPAKVVLKPFRNQRMAKNHVSSEIQFDPKDDFITITSEMKSHACSSYRLGASTMNDDIEFDCDPYVYRNCLKMDVKVLVGCLSNFSHMKGLSDLTLKITGQRVSFTNTITDATRKDGTVVTEFNLSSKDFMNFDVHDKDIEFTFSFREFKLFASFAEQLKLPVNIHFKGPDDPVIIVVKMETFEARLCLSTRQMDPFTNLGPTPSSAVSSAGRISSVSTQNSNASSRNGNVPQQEVNRRRDNTGTASGSATTSETQSNAEPPASKRIRRTEAAPPRAELTQSTIPFQNENGNDDVADLCPNAEEPEQQDPIPLETIGGLVERLDKRNNSPAYKAIQRIIGRPRMTEADYLKTLPGHDIVLCPVSDEEVEDD